MQIEGLESKDLKEADQKLDNVRDKVSSYRRIRFLIKMFGNIALIIALFNSYWLASLLLWILFFPDLNDFVRFYKHLK